MEDMKEYETFLSDNALYDFLLALRKYKPATPEENCEIFSEIQKGNPEARDLMVKKNIRLVVSIVMKNRRHLKSYEKIDLLQDGVIGLLTAIDRYNPEDGAFSTYATYWIKQAIGRGLDNSDSLVRRPVHFEELKRKYFNLIEKQPDLTDIEIKDILGIADDTLRLLKEDYRLESASLDATSNEEDDRPLSNMVGYQEKGFSTVLDKEVEKELLVYLKREFNHLDYFILYYRVLSEEKKTLEEIAQEFNITRERIRQKESNILRKIKRLYDSKIRELRIKLDEKTRKELPHLRILPIHPSLITEYLYLKSYLPEEVLIVYKYLIFSPYEYDERYFSQKLNLTIEEVRSSKKLIDTIRKTRLQQERALYREFHKSIIKELGTKIYDVDPDMNIQKYKTQPKQTLLVWKNKSYDDLLEILNNLGESIPENLVSKLKVFFNVRTRVYPINLEHKINVAIFDLNRNLDLNPTKVKKVLDSNESKFTPLQKDMILYKYGLLSKSGFQEKYPGINPLSGRQYVMNKFYRIYFHIKNNRSYEFTKEKYLKVRDRCSKETIRILDAFFIEGMSHKELSLYLNESLDKTRKLLRLAKEQAQNIYMGITSNLKLDLSIYEEYLLWNDVDFREPLKSIVEEYILLHKSYEEISKKHNITVRQVSNYITDAIWKIDFYRFNITSAPKYNRDTLMQNIKTLSKQDGEILTYYLNNSRDTKKTIEHFNIPLSTLKRLRDTLYKRCREAKINTIELNDKDIEEILNLSPIEQFLTEREVIVLSFMYGIKTKYNEEGIKLTNEEIKKKFSLDVYKLYHIKRDSTYKIKSYKAGFIHAPLDFIKKEELEELMKDPHLPISDKEKSILRRLYGLYDTPISTIKELSSVYNETENSLIRRTYRAVVQIRRYENHEIDGNISFIHDVAPYLKFFPKIDQQILRAIYEDNLPATKIAKKFDLSVDQAISLTYKLRIKLRDIQEEKTGVDFDYFYSHVYDRDIVYYGNLEYTIRIFEMYYEEHMSYTEILEEYPELQDEERISGRILNLLVAVLKKKEGITLPISLSYETIRDYYLEHQSTMSLTNKTYYYNYLRRHNEISMNGRKISEKIYLDLLESDPNYIHLSNETKESIRELIRDNKERLSFNVIRDLINLFELDAKEFMSGHDKRTVLNFLARYNEYALENKKIIQ